MAATRGRRSAPVPPPVDLSEDSLSLSEMEAMFQIERAIGVYSHRDVVPGAEVVDLLLDIRNTIDVGPHDGLAVSGRP